MNEDWLSADEMMAIVGTRPTFVHVIEAGPTRSCVYLFDQRGSRTIGVVIEPATPRRDPKPSEPIQVGRLMGTWRDESGLLTIRLGRQLLYVGVDVPRVDKRRVAIAIAERAVARLFGEAAASADWPENRPS